MEKRFDGFAVPGRDFGGCVAVLSLQQRQRSDINMSSLNWRDGEIRQLLTTMGEKVMQSHLTKTGRDGAIYDKVELSLRGFRQDKKHVVSKI